MIKAYYYGKINNTHEKALFLIPTYNKGKIIKRAVSKNPK